MPEEDWRLLLRLLSDEDQEVRGEASAALRLLAAAEPRVRAALVDGLETEESSVGRGMMIMILEEHAQDRNVRAAIVARVINGADDERSRAIRALATVASLSEILDVLSAYQDDPSVGVRLAVVEAYRPIRDLPEAQSALQAAMLDDDNRVRRFATRARWGEDGPDISRAVTDDGVASETSAAIESVEAVLTAVDDLLQADHSDLEEAFLRSLRDDLGLLQDLIQRSAGAELKAEIGRLERLQHHLEGFKERSLEVVDLAMKLGWAVEALRHFTDAM